MLNMPNRPVLFAGISIVGATMALGGCAMPNSSNPTLAINSASVSGNRATLDMQIDNPSDMDIRVNSADWTLVYGPLPVADGSWELGVDIPSKGNYRFSKQVPFSSPAMDPGAGEVELTGSLDVETIGNSGNMAITEGSFNAKSATRR